MKQYIWFHPLYVKQTSQSIIDGQMNNALSHNYIVLKENELYKVRAWDHLTIAGHSTAPPNLLNDDEDTGLYIQGEGAEQCVNRLQKAGLRVSPKILSLECCNAAVENGIGQMLSAHPFFKTSLVEANHSSIGRNPGHVKWACMPVDSFGRVVMRSYRFPWVFLVAGTVVAEYAHGQYLLRNILQILFPKDFHACFFAHYTPGFFLGRAGRYCLTGNRLSLEQAILFAEEDPDSASAQALEKVMQESILPLA